MLPLNGYIFVVFVVVTSYGYSVVGLIAAVVVSVVCALLFFWHFSVHS